MPLPVHQSIFQQGSHGVDVVLAHFSDVLKHEGQRLQDAILNVELWDAVLVHEGWQHGEGGAGLRNDGYGNGRTHPVLSFLDFEIIQESCQHIVWTIKSKENM